MNNERRKAIDAQIKALEALQPRLEEARFVLAALEEDLRDVAGDVQDIVDEEQEYYDNMPESLQSGDKGQAAEHAISELGQVTEKLDDDIDFNALDLEELIGLLDSAKHG
jgi:hypothetical protein